MCFVRQNSRCRSLRRFLEPRPRHRSRALRRRRRLRRSGPTTATESLSAAHHCRRCPQQRFLPPNAYFEMHPRQLRRPDTRARTESRARAAQHERATSEKPAGKRSYAGADENEQQRKLVDLLIQTTEDEKLPHRRDRNLNQGFSPQAPRAANHRSSPSSLLCRFALNRDDMPYSRHSSASHTRISLRSVARI